MADRARQHAAAARAVGEKKTSRRKAATTKTATKRKLDVAAGVKGKRKPGTREEAVALLKAGRAGERTKGTKGTKGTQRTQRTQRTKKRDVGVVWEPCLALADLQQDYFCLKMAEGPYSQKSAYLQAYPDSAPDSARANASRLMTNDNVRQRIAHLKKELIKDVKLTVEESIRWCLLVRDTPVGYIDDESPLAQEVTRKEMQMGGAHGQLKRGTADEGNEVETPAAVLVETRVKMPSKMDAQKQIDKLMGFDRDKEDPLEKAVDAMADMIRMIREKRGPETA